MRSGRLSADPEMPPGRGGVLHESARHRPAAMRSWQLRLDRHAMQRPLWGRDRSGTLSSCRVALAGSRSFILRRIDERIGLRVEPRLLSMGRVRWRAPILRRLLRGGVSRMGRLWACSKSLASMIPQGARSSGPGRLAATPVIASKPRAVERRTIAEVGDDLRYLRPLSQT